MRLAPGQRASVGTRRARRGAVLVLFGLISVALFAILAVVLEVGAARVAQARMASALDPAAREALRLRDTGAADAELVRRAAARDLVARAFDADLDLATADRGLDPHAGGVVPTEPLFGLGGVGGFDPSAIGTWEPSPETNRLNAAHGDLVAGSFRPATAGAAEAADYTRADFEPASPAGAASAEAFLVRARRTRLDAPLDRLPGVSSAGPPLPLLFGLGTTLRGDADDPGAYDPRSDGLTVRATVIAAARPALAVALGPDGVGLLEWGSASDSPDGLAGGGSGVVDEGPSPLAPGAGSGAGPVRGPGGSPSVAAVTRDSGGERRAVLALDAALFAALEPGAPLELEAEPSGVFAAGTQDRLGWLVTTAGRIEVGQRLAPLGAGALVDGGDAFASAGTRAVVLARTEADGSLRAVAFGGLDELQASVDPERNALVLTARLAPASVASSHASVHAPSAWLALETGGPLEVPGLRAEFEALANLLLAPVVVR